MPRPHAWRAKFLEVQRRTAQHRHKESRRLLGSFFHVLREQVADLGFFQFLIKVGQHPEDIRLTHDAINLRIRPRSLRRPAGRGINDSLHVKYSSGVVQILFNSSYDAPFGTSVSTGYPSWDQPGATTRPIGSFAPPKPPCIFDTSSNPSCPRICAAI